MRAAAWNNANTLDLVERPVPGPASGEVLVRTGTVGICGSDLHFYSGEFRGLPGMVPGHEIAGVVESGDGFAPGTSVAVQPTIACRACAACLRGQAPTCTRLRLMGISTPGGLQEYLAVPAANAFPLPPSVSPELGALAEPLAVAVRAMNRAQIAQGDRVVVLGAGTIGLLTLLLAREVANEVAITARYPHQRELALALGADAVFEPGSEELASWAKANPVDAVFESVGGSASTLSEAVNVVRGGGTVLALGVFTSDVSLPARKLVNQEIRLIGSVVYGDESGQPEFGAAVGKLARYARQLEQLRTAAYPLGEANAAFEHALDKRRGAVKISIEVTR
ncbi:MAG: alcohol dehydrogenase catalytic domain-containing protein [Dehalococcoidia bacterium]|nr:alcohol dehydrogenase catalytic domain-containing protein [Dehalococcoidia bacterium]